MALGAQLAQEERFTRGPSFTTPCMVRASSNGLTGDSITATSIWVRSQERELTFGRMVKCTKVSSNLTSVMVRVHFTTLMASASNVPGKMARKTALALTSGLTEQNTSCTTLMVISKERAKWELKA